MSSGHRHEHGLTEAELKDLLGEALANPGVKARLARPYRLVLTYDIPYLGSSSVGGHNVFLDRHLRYEKLPFGIIPIGGERRDVKPALVRHERLEQAIEDVLGWPYKIAHEVATAWEHKLVKDPDAYEKALEPYLKYDEHEEKITRCPTDLDLRPILAPPVDKKLLEHIRQCQNNERVSQESVAYGKATTATRRCGRCNMFVAPEYGGPACTLVKDPIQAVGLCRRFAAGNLAE